MQRLRQKNSKSSKAAYSLEKGIVTIEQAASAHNEREKNY